MLCIPPQKLAKPQKYKNPLKSIKMKLKKKTSQGTVSMNMYTKFSADWNTFRYRSGSVFVTDSQTHRLKDSQTHIHFRHWSFRSPVGLKG